MGHPRDARTRGGKELQDKPGQQKPTRSDIHEDEKHHRSNRGVREPDEVGPHHRGDCARGPDDRQRACRLGDDVGDRRNHSAGEIERGERDSSEAILDVVPKDPEEQHVQPKVDQTAMEKQRRDNRDQDALVWDEGNTRTLSVTCSGGPIWSVGVANFYNAQRSLLNDFTRDGGGLKGESEFAIDVDESDRALNGLEPLKTGLCEEVNSDAGHDENDRHNRRARCRVLITQRQHFTTVGVTSLPMAQRRRLDAELVRRGLASSRDAARREIEAGRVIVGGAPANKASRQVHPGDDVQVLGPPPKFVSRAGQKLEAALEHFEVDPAGLRVLDAGSSTGGFTDCLLQADAAHVYAIDVGTNQLHEKLRGRTRVTVREKTDIRKVTLASIGDPVDLTVGDLSFISLSKVLPNLVALTKPRASMLLLIKPQFEAGRQEVSKGRGVITDPAIWDRVIDEVNNAVLSLGAVMLGVMESPVKGTSGNVEFISHIRTGDGAAVSDALGEPGSASIPAAPTRPGR